ncbi:MAG: tetratricopeptide repeat protein [Chloroflexi bacterium]|nr:tetratricopeptide repeat protein [Chloroflexota bacterium]MCC6891785.1 tetratricopeptide repeat protein [Anaerolineae bacterium]
MPANRELYERAMNAGYNAAWDKDWPQAIAAYGQAIQEFPDDHEAHINLGLALLEVGRLDDALRVYTRAHQINPNDPIPLEKSADVLEKVGRLKEAAQQYINVAEVYLTQRDLDKAIFNWQQATRLTPGMVAIHAKLAQAYERLGQKGKSIREYLVLAQNFQRLGENNKALVAAQRALKLDPKNVTILNALRALESGSELSLPTLDKADAAPAKNDSNSSTSKIQQVIEADPLGPMGETMSYAMAMLASFVMEGGALDASGGDALQALELQRQSINDQAIQAYQRAESRLNHPALKMNLGGLLVLANRNDESIKLLGEAAMHPQLAPGAFHALGKAYFALNKHKQAINYLLQAAQAVDSAHAMSSETDMQIADSYEHLLEVLQNRPVETLTAINKRFTDLLTGKEWKQRIGETRRQLEDTLRSQGEQGVVDILIANRSNELTEAVARIDRYTRQGLYTLAMDEAHRAVEFSAFYLPVHVRMAEIMMKEGRVRQAINKYNMIAKTYLVRGENDRAASILSEVLEMAPLDISVRESLIELLESEQRWDEALDQYVDLADTHHQLGNFDMSRDIFGAAERLANRVGATPDKIVRIKHRIADIDQMRLDIRKAQKTYDEIIQLVPDDERAHRMLVDLHYRQGSPSEAIKKLDALLRIYAKNKQPNRITQLLEELVTTYPNDTGLRSRLAAIYTQLKRKNDAIRQLDALGELQLEAGAHQEATNTIRQIIALNPDGVEDYRKLLMQLGG